MPPQGINKVVVLEVFWAPCGVMNPEFSPSNAATTVRFCSQVPPHWSVGT